MMVYVDLYSIMMNDLMIDLWVDGQYESVCNRFDMNIDVAMAKNAHLWEEIRNKELPSVRTSFFGTLRNEVQEGSEAA